MHMAVPPSFLYPAAYPLPVPDLGIYPRGTGGNGAGHHGGHPGNQNRGQNSSRGGGHGGSNGHSGGRNSNGHWPQWHQNGGWSGDGNWSQRGHPVSWMAGAELWGHPARNSGSNYNWASNGNAGGQNRGRGGKNFSASRG